jgi:predicted nucleic acid-binding Zn ribbon protein
MRSKSKKPEDIGGILNQVIKKLDTKMHGPRESIVQAWHEVSQPEALSHTKPVAFKNNILTIEVDSSTWFYVLSLKKKSILEDMKKKIGKNILEDIKFRIGEIT